MSLEDYTLDELERELKRRGKHTTTSRCPTCRGKWSMTFKHYQGRGEHWHCDGCNKRIENCTC